MTTPLESWAARWGLPVTALDELCRLSLVVTPGRGEGSESDVQSQIRLAAAHHGKLLWRNNRGAGEMKDGSFIRWGLANDSKQLGDAVKSADLIGIEPVVVTPDWLGKTIGRFFSVEVKPGNWRPGTSKREEAQAIWAAIVNRAGGRAIITNDPSSI